MKPLFSVVLALVFAQAAHAAGAPATTDAAAAAASAAAPEAPPAPPPDMANANFCLYAKEPASDMAYKGLGRVKLARGTYGGVRNELPAFVAQAKADGADAVINYNGSQRFGFWPWRLVRPVLTGTAIKFSGDHVPDCEASGGSTLMTVMQTNVEPPRR